jgi:hypothetical protein
LILSQTLSFFGVWALAVRVISPIIAARQADDDSVLLLDEWHIFIPQSQRRLARATPLDLVAKLSAIVHPSLRVGTHFDLS